MHSRKSFGSLFKSCGFAFLAGSTLLGNSASAQNPFFEAGDLILHFQEEGGTETVYVALGKASSLYRGSATGPTADRQKLDIVNIKTTLDAAFGADWATKTTIYAGLAAVRSSNPNQTSTGTVVDGDMARTVYISRARLGVGTVGTAGSDAWDMTTAGQTTAAANGIVALNNNFETNYLIQVAQSPVSVSVIDNQNPFVTAGIQDTAYGYFPGGIQQQGGAAAFGTFGDAGEVEFALDLYRILPVDSATLSATMQAVVMAGSRVGTYEGTITIAADGDVSFITQGSSTPTAPDIAVSAPDSLTSGSSSVSFGTVNTGSSGSPLTFTITNAGTGDLTGIVVSKTGSTSGDFTIDGPADTTLIPSATTTFTVTFSPSADGARAATLEITSNDPDENPFTVSLNGSGVTPPPAAPEILVERGATPLSTGGTLALEDTVTGTDGNPETITIRNTGTADLTGLSVTVEGTNPGDFPVTQPLVATLAPAESTTFTFGFSPNADGPRTAVVKISSNDSDENPFDINLSGTGFTPAPEITVLTSTGSPLVSAAATSAQLFGNITVGSTSAAKILTIRNDGDAPLGPLSATKVGSNAADFLVGTLSSTTLAPGASTTVSVSFKPLAAGARIATLQIGSNDADENPFTIALSGTGEVPLPDIDVQQPAKSSLVDGKSTKNFGTVKLKKTKVLTFTIKNTGNGTLSGLAVSSSGKNAKQFAVSKPKAASLAPGASTTFTVTFQPVKAGANSALIKVASNDPNENPFDIPVKGVGAK